MKKEKPMLSVAALIQAQGKWDRTFSGNNKKNYKKICIMLCVLKKIMRVWGLSGGQWKWCQLINVTLKIHIRLIHLISGASHEFFFSFVWCKRYGIVDDRKLELGQGGLVGWLVGWLMVIGWNKWDDYDMIVVLLLCDHEFVFFVFFLRRVKSLKKGRKVDKKSFSENKKFNARFTLYGVWIIVIWHRFDVVIEWLD